MKKNTKKDGTINVKLQKVSVLEPWSRVLGALQNAKKDYKCNVYKDSLGSTVVNFGDGFLFEGMIRSNLQSPTMVPERCESTVLTYQEPTRNLWQRIKYVFTG